MQQPNHQFKNITRRSILASIPVTTGALSMPAAGNNETNDTNESDAPQEPETERVPYDSNQVRLTHLSPDAGPVDIYADGERAFSGIETHQQSDFEYYEPGVTGTAHVTRAGESVDNALLEADVELDGGPVSLTLVGEVCEQSERPLQLVTVEDNYSEIVSDHARLKAIHASPDAPALDYRTKDGDDLVTGLEFAEYGYSTLTSGKTSISVHRSGESEPLARFAIDPEPNSVYSAFSVGYIDVASAPSAADDLNFSLGVIEDVPPSD